MPLLLPKQYLHPSDYKSLCCMHSKYPRVTIVSPSAFVNAYFALLKFSLQLRIDMNGFGECYEYINVWNQRLYQRLH